MMSERGIKSSAIPSYTSHERIYFNFPFGANGAKQTVPTHLSHFLTAKTRDQLSPESHTPTDVEGHGTRRTKLYNYKTADLSNWYPFSGVCGTVRLGAAVIMYSGARWDR